MMRIRRELAIRVFNAIYVVVVVVGSGS